MDKFNFIDNTDDSKLNNDNSRIDGSKYDINDNKNNKYSDKKNKTYFKNNHNNKHERNNKFNNDINLNKNESSKDLDESIDNNNDIELNKDESIEDLDVSIDNNNVSKKEDIIVDEKKDDSEDKDFEQLFEEEIENLEFTQEFSFVDKISDTSDEDENLDNNEDDSDSEIPNVTLVNHGVGVNGFSEDGNLATYRFSDDVVENDESNIDEESLYDNDRNSWAKNSSLGKIHFSYQFRVTCLVIGILILFISSFAMIFTALEINTVKDTTYSDSSKTTYQVCGSGSGCFGSNLEYNKELTERVVANFSYEALFTEDIDYDLKYRVVLYNRIYDGNKVIYEDKDTIIDDDSVKKKNNAYDYSTEVNIDYKKYNDFVLNYEKYNSDNNALLDVILYVDSDDGSREVSSITIPLGKDTFKIDTNDSVKTEHDIKAITNEWTNSNTVIVVIGSLLIILSLFLLFRLTRLVLATLSRKTKYELELSSIFKEFDKYLVVARGGYESDVVKNVVKVDSFSEMLNVREILNKPIIFSKINNVKSEFIIDDDDLIYKFVLKEADVEE